MNGLDFRQNPPKLHVFCYLSLLNKTQKNLKKNDGTVQRCCVTKRTDRKIEDTQTNGQTEPNS